ncbi:MAG: hypothetical protein LBI04_11090 [Treponema sp.]|jgi:hypothetical protein|nr:hypothetical protein [Treponema sp.]
MGKRNRKKIILPPKEFKTKEASRYVAAIELLAEYKSCKKTQLDFAVRWLKKNMEREKEWDMGKEVKDGMYFPLSDSWRKDEDRIKDCTHRINKLLEKL